MVVLCCQLLHREPVMMLNATVVSNSIKSLVKFSYHLYFLKLIFSLEIVVQNCQHFRWNEIKASHFPQQPCVLAGHCCMSVCFYVTGNLVPCISSDNGL